MIRNDCFYLLQKTLLVQVVQRDILHPSNWVSFLSQYSIKRGCEAEEIINLLKYCITFVSLKLFILEMEIAKILWTTMTLPPSRAYGVFIGLPCRLKFLILFFPELLQKALLNWPWSPFQTFTNVTGKFNAPLASEIILFQLYYYDKEKCWYHETGSSQITSYLLC